jgi:hypothetical protein
VAEGNRRGVEAAALWRGKRGRERRMRFHDNAGLSGQWHDYWERMGCEALEREKLYPRGVETVGM